MEPLRVCKLVVDDLYHSNKEQHRDLRQSEKSDPDQHQGDKSDPDLHRSERPDPNPLHCLQNMHL
jgi:hypothetical protein